MDDKDDSIYSESSIKVNEFKDGLTRFMLENGIPNFKVP